jgi:hypothetical protein
MKKKKMMGGAKVPTLCSLLYWTYLRSYSGWWQKLQFVGQWIWSLVVKEGGTKKGRRST